MPFDAAVTFALLSNVEILALALSRPGASVLRELEAIMVARIAERDRMAAEIATRVEAEGKAAVAKVKAPRKPRASKASKAAAPLMEAGKLIKLNRKIRRDALKVPVQHSYGPAWVGVENPLLQCRLAAMEARHGKPVRGDAGYETFLSASGDVYAVSLVSAGVWTIKGADWIQWTRDARDELAAEGRPMVEVRLAAEAEAQRIAAEVREAEIAAEQRRRAADQAAKAIETKGRSEATWALGLPHGAGAEWKPVAYPAPDVKGAWLTGSGEFVVLGDDDAVTVWHDGAQVQGLGSGRPEGTPEVGAMVTLRPAGTRKRPVSYTITGYSEVEPGVWCFHARSTYGVGLTDGIATLTRNAA